MTKGVGETSVSPTPFVRLVRLASAVRDGLRSLPFLRGRLFERLVILRRLFCQLWLLPLLPWRRLLPLLFLPSPWRAPQPCRLSPSPWLPWRPPSLWLFPLLPVLLRRPCRPSLLPSLPWLLPLPLLFLLLPWLARPSCQPGLSPLLLLPVVAPPLYPSCFAPHWSAARRTEPSRRRPEARRRAIPRRARLEHA